MSRIRSVHPGFFTDERLVCVSMAARMLFIGLGVEADDKGIFEWKPLTLKMRVFPADSLDIGELLSELLEADAIASYELGGRKYGAIRNFRKFQSPKTPNDIHPIPDDFRNYVGLPAVISETFPQKGEKAAAVPGTFPPKGEKSIQREDGGEEEEEREREKEEAPPSPPEGEAVRLDEIRDAFDSYNVVANELGLPKARDLTEQRRRAIRSRLKAAGGLAAWHEALGNIRRSAFLTGKTDKGFLADLDFVCQAKSFQRLIEGYYGANGRAPPGNVIRMPGVQTRESASRRQFNAIAEVFDDQTEPDDASIAGAVPRLSGPGT